jgi:transposase
VNWPDAADLTETQLEERLFPNEHLASSVQRPPSVCDHIYDQLSSYRNVNLTLTQLWLEYREKHSDGYQYTQFCEYYHRWRGRFDYYMRQEHRAGEQTFIDYSEWPDYRQQDLNAMRNFCKQIANFYYVSASTWGRIRVREERQVL